MKPAAAWPIAVIGVLAVTVGANVALVIAARDPNAYVVEPRYYEKALAWDSTMAVGRRSDALGWRVEATIGRRTANGTPLVVTLADSAGDPVAGARVDVELVHNLEPEHPVRARLTAAAPGRYDAVLPLPRPGLWEITLTADRGADHFVADLRRDAPGALAR